MKKVIIIGASSGIGAALVPIFITENFQVGITGRRANLLQNIQQIAPQQIHFQSFDVNQTNAIEELETLVNKMGGLDILIYSAGLGDENPNLDFEIENSGIETQVQAFVKISTWAYNFFKKQQQGHLVIISSIAALISNPIAPAYNACKAFQSNYTFALLKKSLNEKSNIAITDIRPGFVDTAMAKGDGLFWVASPTKAAQQIYKAIKQKKDVVYITKRWWLIAFVIQKLPRFILKRM